MEELQQSAEPIPEPGPGVWYGARLLFINPSKGFDIILAKWQVLDQLVVIGMLSLARALSRVDLYELSLPEAIGKILLYCILGILFGWMGLWLVARLIHFLNELFKGNSEANVVMTGIAFAWLPLCISNLFIFSSNFYYFDGLDIILYFVIMTAFIYSFILMFIVNQKISGLLFFKNLGAIGIPVLFLFLLVMLYSVFRNSIW